MNQYDAKVRVVSAANLKEMCIRASKDGHRFDSWRSSGVTMRVEYNDPDDEGRGHPITAFFPIYQGEGTTLVVLSITRVVGGKLGWLHDFDAFLPITHGPRLVWDAGTETWSEEVATS